MASLKEIRQRISSVRSTRQITNAMKMVSAAKLKKAQNAIIQIRPYANRLNDILVHLSGAVEPHIENPYIAQREPGKVLLVLVSANRGLCGGFNANVVRTIQELIGDRYPAQWSAKNLDLLLIGRKGGEILKGKGYGTWERFDHLLENPSYEQTRTLADTLMNQFRSGRYDRMDLVYNQFKNAATQTVIHEQFLPVQLPQAEEPHREMPFYLFEPTLEYLITTLVPEALRVKLHKTILDSIAAEHGARMTAMYQATDNATEILHDLNIEYNKARQAAITSEIIEIISGAEVLRT